MHRPSRQAFTLLELSVVLAIIGILVGGVLATQSYIRTAQMTTTINEAKLILQAFDQFQDKYSAVPGDMSTASSIWPGAYNGDGNGFVFQGSYGGGAGDNAAEHFYVFQHLNRAGYIAGSYTGLAGPAGANNVLPGTNVPAGSMPNSAMYISHWNSANGFYASGTVFSGNYGHYLQLGAPFVGNLPYTSLFTAREAYELDSKFDNGKPGTGWMRTASSIGCATTTDAQTANYQATDTGPSCFYYMTRR